MANYNGSAMMGTASEHKQPDSPRGLPDSARVGARVGSRRRSRRGIALVLGLFVFGAAMMILLFRAPRSADRAPDVPRAAPRRVLRVVSIDVRTRPETGDAIGRWLKPIDADLYFLQGVRSADVRSIGRALGMSRPDGDDFYPAQNLAGPSAPFGNAIFSRFPLYELRSVPARGGSFGVWAVAVVDNVQFLVASIDTTDAEAAEGRGASAGVERGKELTMLAEAFAATRQSSLIIGARVDGWEQSDERWLRSRQAIVQSLAGIDPAERVITIGRSAAGSVSVEPMALPGNPPGRAIVVSVRPSRVIGG